MDKKGILLLVVLVVILFLLRPKQAKKTIVVPVSNSNEQFYAPYQWPTAGLYPEVAPFETTVNIHADLPAWARISTQYMPTFGFVGMVGVKA